MKRFVTLNPAKLLEASFAPVVIVLLTLYMWWTSPVFMTTINITNILLQVSILAIVAFGMTFVIIAGQLDLSQGSANALIGVIAADVMVRADNLWLGILVGLALGVGVGVFNGFVTAYLKGPSFITTLGVLVMARGLAREVTAGNTVGGLPEAFTDFMSKQFLGLGMPVLVAVLWGVIMHVLLSRTQFGLHVFSVGGNPEASHRAGINVKRVLLAVFIVRDCRSPCRVSPSSVVSALANPMPPPFSSCTPSPASFSEELASPAERDRSRAPPLVCFSSVSSRTR